MDVIADPPARRRRHALVDADGKKVIGPAARVRIASSNVTLKNLVEAKLREFVEEDIEVVEQ